MKLNKARVSDLYTVLRALAPADYPTCGEMEDARDIRIVLKESCPEYIEAREYAENLQGVANLKIEAEKTRLEGKDRDGSKLAKFAEDLQKEINDTQKKEDKSKLERYAKEGADEVEPKLSKTQADLAVKLLESKGKDMFRQADPLLELMDYLKAVK